ncbi:hypothetical protein [Chroococcidiopsis sp.]|uniref:hypothetical protein n=1 Tax=Chroococcidiopsis sp. TaxID=3088168 RepID=UPI003F3DB481
MYSQFFYPISHEDALKLEFGSLWYTLLELDGVLYKGGASSTNINYDFPIEHGCVVLFHSDEFKIPSFMPKKSEKYNTYITTSDFLTKQKFIIKRHT